MEQKKKNPKPKQSAETPRWPQEVVLEIYIYGYAECVHIRTKMFLWKENGIFWRWNTEPLVPTRLSSSVVSVTCCCHTRTLTIYKLNTTWHSFIAWQIVSLCSSFLLIAKKGPFFLQTLSTWWVGFFLFFPFYTLIIFHSSPVYSFWRRFIFFYFSPSLMANRCSEGDRTDSERRKTWCPLF